MTTERLAAIRDTVEKCNIYQKPGLSRADTLWLLEQTEKFSSNTCVSCGRYREWATTKQGVTCDCPIRYSNSTCHPASPLRRRHD